MSSKAPKTYNNNLMPIARTRVLTDRNLVKTDAKGYSESDIYFKFNEETVDNQFWILTIGSRDLTNPYFGGFFTFYGLFPDQYPFVPPHILAKTQGLNTRFHPNYYVNGKCCLSILGTWAGPPWTSVQNLGSTSQALKSLFIENPIIQEPGWENCQKEKSDNYNLVITYRTLQVAVLQMLESPPIGFESFLPKMEKTFIELYPKYLERLNNLKYLQGKTIKSPIYDMTITMDIENLLEKYAIMYEKLCKKHNITDNNTNTLNQVTKTLVKSRKSPNEKASLYEVGFKKQSTNGDKDWWIVYETKNGQKRWKKL